MGQELDRLEKQGGKIRLCGDYKVTVNQALTVLTVDQYPLPKPEELFATLGNGHKFTKLDLRQAYLQMESSRPYVTINTHQGLYQYSAFSLESKYHNRVTI